MTTSTIERTGISGFAAGEIRAVLGRQGVSQRELADRIGRQQFWLSRRIGANATVDMTLEEIAEMAQALGVDAEGLVVAALRACRDSNPKPSDLVFAEDPYRCRVCGCAAFSGGLCRWCRDDLEGGRAQRSAWELAA